MNSQTRATIAALSLAILTIACPAAPAPSATSATSATPAASTPTTPTAPIAKPNIDAEKMGVGKDVARVALEEYKCAPPTRKGGFRVCGQTLVTRVSKEGALEGFAASLEGVTLFSLQKPPAHLGDLVAFGAAGQDAVLSQMESDRTGKFDVELSAQNAAVVLCPGRVVATTTACKVLRSKTGVVSLALVANGTATTWAVLPVDALVELTPPPLAK